MQWLSSLWVAASNEEASPGLQLFMAALSICGPLLTAVLGWLGAKLIALLNAKISNEALSGMLARLTTTTITLVREAEQIAVAKYKEAKDPNSPGGVNLTKEEGEAIKQAVVDKIKELWGPEGLVKLSKVLGLSECNLTAFLAAKVEETVHTEKKKKGEDQ